MVQPVYTLGNATQTVAIAPKVVSKEVQVTTTRPVAVSTTTKLTELTTIMATTVLPLPTTTPPPTMATMPVEAPVVVEDVTFSLPDEEFQPVEEFGMAKEVFDDISNFNPVNTFHLFS